MRFPCSVCWFAFVVVAVFPLSAQSPNGNINGLVSDPARGAIIGAEVVAVNDLTGVQYATKTNGEGIYVLPNLPPGPYRVQVSKVGFKTTIKPDIILNVADAISINFTLPVGALHEIVTVEGGAPLVNTESGSVSTVTDRHFVENLPLNGRSFNTLLQLTPGTLTVPATAATPGQFAVNGQRANSNYFTVDGVSANFGSTLSVSPGPTGGGAIPAFDALGGTSSLASVDAVQEFRIETSSFAPEYGRVPGGQIVITTRSGANQFHGELFDYVRNDIFDANNWFANHAGNRRPEERQNDVGGTFSGPVVRNKTFFFLSYEGLRLRQPATQVISVPSFQTRSSANSFAAPYINAYPNPPASTTGSSASTVPFTGSYSDSATVDAGSVRIDHELKNRMKIFGRYDQAPSTTAARRDSLSEILSADANTKTGTLGTDVIVTPWLENSFRVNYSIQTAGTSYSLDSFGGAVPPSIGLLVPSPFSNGRGQGIFLPSDAPSYILGHNSENRVRQLEFSDTIDKVIAAHEVKIGGDYRSILTTATPVNFAAGYLLFSPLQQFASSNTADLVVGALDKQGDALFRNFSLFAQDTWKAGARLTLTYGLRWEVNPAPVGQNGTFLAAWLNVQNPSQTGLAPPGTPVWQTTYDNVAPRIGVAYKLNSKGDFVVRGGWGLFFDLGTGEVASLLTGFPNFASKFAFGLTLPLPDASAITPVFSSQPPYQTASYINAFAPDLKLPRSHQWNASIEKSLGSQQSLSVTYVGQVGRRLLRVEDEAMPNANFQSPFLLTTNGGTSSYNALQTQFRRRLTAGLQVLASHTWAHSIDNDSNDFYSVVSSRVISAQNDRASSDFDVRHNLTGAVAYSLPRVTSGGVLAALANSWDIDGVVQIRSGFPINVVSSSIAVPGVTSNTLLRPDVVPNTPIWLFGRQYPGRKALNAAAFDAATPASQGRQGDLGRNAFSGFRMAQVDLSVSRAFNLGDKCVIRFRTDAFNILNRANFANPVSNLSLATFGQAAQTLNQGLSSFGGGLNLLYQVGGPRSLQLSLKLQF